VCWAIERPYKGKETICEFCWCWLRFCCSSAGICWKVYWASKIQEVQANM